MSSNQPNTSARVKLLPPTLANQIAAGEVVERPSSVLKELLENSLDSGATRIEIDLERGGTDLIRVRDNGAGIPAEDLVLALSRHATSKIHSLRDLEALGSLGFRGEALPSIASVARLELSSKSEDHVQGYRVSADGNADVAAPEPVALPQGTVVVVRDLFFNTPARRKFLRAEKTEYRHADEVARRIALSRFDIDMQLSHNARTVWSVRPVDSDAARLRRLIKLCGQSFCDHALQIEFDGPQSRLTGWIAQPSFARNHADLQHFFLNGRMIKDRVVSHAIRQAHADSLPEGAHPAYVLYLDMDPARVDINVHPAKHEVRFRDSRSVHDFLFRALQRSLEEAAAPSLLPDSGSLMHSISTSFPAGGAVAQSGNAVRDQVAAYARLQGTTPGAAAGRYTLGVSSDNATVGRAIGEVGGRFLLALVDSVLVVTDWRRARELILYRRLLTMLETDGTVSTKPLLLPFTVTLAESDIALAASGEDWLAVAGIDLNVIGPTSVMLREIPNVVHEFDGETLVRELVAVIASSGDLTSADGLLRALAAHAAGQERLPASTEALDGCLRELQAVIRDGEVLDFVKRLDSDTLALLTTPPAHGDVSNA
jgi:DNA mismatch repair protein MutL